jgi:choline dehydrogenase
VELRSLGIPVAQALPVGERLLDHCGTDVTWELTRETQDETAAHADATGLFEAFAVAKASSSMCESGSWDLHLLPWIYPVDGTGRYQASSIVFHLKPLSSGRLRLRSTDPIEAPLVERGFLARPADVPPLLEGIELARSIGAAEPLRSMIRAELSPGATDPERYLRDTIRNYFHPAGTCPMGSVVGRYGDVLGIDGLFVADASIMPTIPRANTNLTTAAIAERIAETI